jgi:hypothetical protein
VIGPFKADRKGFLNEIVEPLQEKEETIYVVPKSDAEDHVKKRFPHKRVKQVRGGLLPSTIKGFLRGIYGGEFFAAWSAAGSVSVPS